MFLLSDKISHAQYLFWDGIYDIYLINSSATNGSNSGNSFGWLSLPIASVNFSLFLVEPRQNGHMSFLNREKSKEERGDILAAQVDIPTDDTPKEEKDGMDSNTPKPGTEYVEIGAMISVIILHLTAKFYTSPN